MSQENVELIEAVLEMLDPVQIAIGDGDVRKAAVAAGLGPDVCGEDAEVRFASRYGGGDGPTRLRGPIGIREGFLDWLGPWASYQGRTEAVIDAGHQVVELVRIRATTAHGGVEIEHRAGTVYRLKDKRIVAITFYLDAAHALEAAGLSE